MKTKQRIFKTMLSFFSKAMILAALCWATNVKAQSWEIIDGYRIIPGTQTCEMVECVRYVPGHEGVSTVVVVPEQVTLTVDDVTDVYTVVGMGDGNRPIVPVVNNYIDNFVIPATVTHINDRAFNDGRVRGIEIRSTNLQRIGKRAFLNSQAIKADFTIPSTVEIIDDGAFSMTALQTVTVPNSVTFLGTEVFKQCFDLTNVVLPQGITSISKGMFHACTKLTGIEYPATVDTVCENAFNTCSALESFDFSGIKVIENSAFAHSGLKEISIPASIDILPAEAFRNCSSLKKVTLENGDMIQFAAYPYNPFGSCPVEEIYWGRKNVPDGACYTITGTLKKVTFGNGVETVGKTAFASCKFLTELTLPVSLKTIGNNAFGACGITELNIPRSVTEIETEAFSANPMTKLSFENDDSEITFGTDILKNNPVEEIYFGRKNVPAYLCDRSTKLKKLTLGNFVESVGNFAFRECTEAAEITISGLLKSVGESAFYKCTGIKGEIDLSHAVSIGSNAFANCTGITGTFDFANLTSIGSAAFFNCSGITEVKFLSPSLTELSNSAFSGCSGITALSLSASITSVGVQVFMNCSSLKTLTLEDGASEISFGSGAFSNCNAVETVYWGRKNVQNSIWYGGTALKNLTLSNFVETIGNSAFSGCTGLTELALPASLVSIGNSTFSGCTGLKEIKIPSLVTSLGSSVFSGCTGLQNVFVPQSVSSIGNSAFSSCTGLQEFTVGRETPLTVSGNVFSGVTTGNVRLIVPAGTAAAYKSAEVWKTFKIEEDLISSAAFPMFKLPAQISVGATVILQVAGENADKLTIFKVNGTATETFAPATAGKYLLEALSEDGKLRIYKYITVN